MPEVAAGGYSPGEDSASHAVCARALKLAAQYQNVNDVQQVCKHHTPAMQSCALLHALLGVGGLLSLFVEDTGSSNLFC